MRIEPVVVLCIAFLASTANLSAAQTPPPQREPALATDLPSAEAVHPNERIAYRAELSRVLQQADARFGGSPCPAAAVDQLTTRMTRFTTSPGIGWVVRARVSGCGRTTIQNVVFRRSGGAPPWESLVLLPGESLADVMQQDGVYRIVVQNLQANPPTGCTTLALHNVYVSARRGHVIFPAPGTTPTPIPGRPLVPLTEEMEAQRDALDLEHAWMEVWPFVACGEDRTVGVVFIPVRGEDSFFPLILPIWPIIEQHGPNARPQEDPA